MYTLKEKVDLWAEKCLIYVTEVNTPIPSGSLARVKTNEEGILFRDLIELKKITECEIYEVELNALSRRLDIWLEMA